MLPSLSGSKDQVLGHTESARVHRRTDFSPEGDLGFQEAETLGEQRRDGRDTQQEDVTESPLDGSEQPQQLGGRPLAAREERREEIGQDAKRCVHQGKRTGYTK